MKIDELKTKVDEVGLVLPVIRPFYEGPVLAAVGAT